jgi:hypothetical protein
MMMIITDGKAYMICGQGHDVGHHCCVRTIASSWSIDSKLHFIVFNGLSWPSL